VPDQGFILSANRTAHPLSVKFATVIAGSALALGAAAATAASSAPARPAAAAATSRLATTHVQSSVRLATLLTPAATAAGRALTPRQIARQMLPSFGWTQRQFPYLNWLWNRESGWNKFAENPYSGAYGIPQALPGAKMASAGPNWRSNARTQIRWGLRYIRSRYGSPRWAWAHEVAYGWY
jgi:resuscitation-promoting factor RpfB